MCQHFIFKKLYKNNLIRIQMYNMPIIIYMLSIHLNVFTQFIKYNNLILLMKFRCLLLYCFNLIETLRNNHI